MESGSIGSLGSSGFEALVASRVESGAEADVARLADAGAAEAADKLEGLFATMLVKEMRSALSTGFFGEGSAGDIYGGWFDEHVGNALARDGALNLAGMIKANLSGKAAAQAAEEPQ